jgi:hypothetical protein
MVEDQALFKLKKSARPDGKYAIAAPNHWHDWCSFLSKDIINFIEAI